MHQITAAATFIATPMTKHIQQFILQVFHGQFVVRNVVVLMPKYSVLGGDTYLVSIFSLHKMKMSEQQVGVVLTVIKVSSFLLCMWE